MRRVLLVLIACAVGATTLAGCSGGGYSVTATFNDVGDLQSRHGVQVADVRVGQVRSIKLTKDFKAKVTMRVASGVRLPKQTRAIVRTTALLGEKFIELRPKDGVPPTACPCLRDGDVIPAADTGEAPELEFVADSAVSLLGAVSSTDLASIVKTGAEGFGGRGDDLKALISDISSFSATLASRSRQITTSIDNLDRATSTIAAGAGDVKALLTNLAGTTTLLAKDRQKAVDALAALSHLARAQDYALDKYRNDIDRQIKQVDAILAVAATQTGQVGTLVDFLDLFVHALPKAIPDDFTQVYMWAVPCSQDTRSPAGCP
ncbi:MAG: virulence factor Mce family protein [Acidimicrobiales bacterium]|jgi:phospholipid/cholesterol/gamma-HCH transport system substrate-binding protein|nr:virulence factor Mce family protein [Acidimicrobiales bacterium]